MDELIEKIDSTGIQSTFEDLYKNKGRPGGQESRRQELLEQQKQWVPTYLYAHCSFMSNL